MKEKQFNRVGNNVAKGEITYANVLKNRLLQMLPMWARVNIAFWVIFGSVQSGIKQVISVLLLITVNVLTLSHIQTPLHQNTFENIVTKEAISPFATIYSNLFNN